jgi:hypothetical protein
MKAVLLATRPASNFLYELPRRNTEESHRIGTHCLEHKTLCSALSYQTGRSFVDTRRHVDNVFNRGFSVRTRSVDVAANMVYRATYFYNRTQNNKIGCRIGLSFRTTISGCMKQSKRNR